MRLAIDVSNNNPMTEALFRRSGAAVLIAKATEGDTFRDATYAGHRAIAKYCGVPFGSYLFLHPSSAGNEAQWYLDYAQPVHGVDIDPIIDCEVTDGLSVSDTAARAEACATVLQAAGWNPYLYSSESFAQSLWQARPALKKLRVWEAQYPGRLTRWSPSVAALRYRFRNGVTVAMWQWTNTDIVGGRGYDCSAILVPTASLISRSV